MRNIERKGQLAMFAGSEHKEPCIVYIRGVNRMDLLIMQIVNTDTLIFEEPNNSNLFDVDIKALEKMRANWDLENAKKTVERSQQRVDELMGKQP